MDLTFYDELANKSIVGEEIDDATCQKILANDHFELLPLVNAAYQVRKHFRGREVVIHIINNAQNGHCPEDCHYCAQAKSSQANIEEYGLKSDEEMVEEARQAYAKGAYRYCMVYAGRGASAQRIERLSGLIRKIKAEYPNHEICISTGLVTVQGAIELKSAGLDQLNHNLNTSEAFYPNICTTHTFADRINTLLAARSAGIHLCSGMIVGMGESHQDVIEVAKRLRSLKAESIPVNFLVPIEGNQLSVPQGLTPEFCLRVLCLFRFLNPPAEIRVGAGREGHLRSMEVLALYPASSLFLQGYLNTKGSSNARTLRMIKDAGFEIKSDVHLDDLLACQSEDIATAGFHEAKAVVKDLKDLRPALKV
ncbi:MAG: biotin synthase BioB [Candidatus Omnitrophica bacterium]|nr:biotin synthase BioB [Candidatus Omnitrophota bacterium]